MATDPAQVLDLEGDSDDLDFDEVDTVHFWEKKQRELLTNVVDYNLSSLADLVGRRAISVSPKYQRRMRWDAGRKSKLIESFLMNVPVPPVFLNEDSYGKFSVIDGKQRLTAVSDFMRGRLRLEGLNVFHELNGKTFDDLPEQFQEVIRTRPTMRAVIVLRQSDDDVKFEVFRRLNTGGVRLNAQEIRNSVYPGPLNDKILELSELPLFHQLLGITDKSSSKIHQEMRDCEFVVRYFALMNSWMIYEGGMSRTLDVFMSKHQTASEDFVRSCEVRFVATLANVEAVFGRRAFRRWLPEKNDWRNQALAALFDAQMFTLQGRDREKLAERRDGIVADFKALFSDLAFRRSIDAATNTPSFLLGRVQAFKAVVDTALA